MLFRKTLNKSKGKEISRRERNIYISNGAVQGDGKTLCPALAELLKTKSPVIPDEQLCLQLERSIRENNKKKSPLPSLVSLIVIFIALTVLQGLFPKSEGKTPFFIADLRIVCVAVGFLLLLLRGRNKSAAKLNAVFDRINRREGISAFKMYVSELMWCDLSDDDGVLYDSYICSENILFDVSYDIFNSACPGDYFTAAIVDIGTEKIFFIVHSELL
ncbi:MAG: hypothetical protein ACI4J7_03615 [Ruminiclostridium sp.]